MGSNQEWIEWGKKDPLFGVASWQGAQRGGDAAWTDEAFYELGRADWEVFERHWQRYGLDGSSCLEIGCGAGRITRHLAGTFALVHALDVSPEMVAYAKAHVPDGVQFHVTNGSAIPLPDRSVASVFSTHVFQHFDSTAHGHRYFQEIARVLQPAGSLMVHLPLHAYPMGAAARVMRLLYTGQKAAGDARAAWRRRRGELIMRGLSYEMGPLRRSLLAAGFGDVEFCTFEASNGDPHPFVFARRL
jgi:SAM-dependent methyltransferase